MERLKDWDRRLASVTEKHLALPGEWGVSDCLMTFGDACEAVTGEDIMAPWRGRYATEQGAARHMRKQGCETVEDVLRDFFQLEPVGRLMAHRGDAGVVEHEGMIVAGYVSERGFAAKGERGLVFLPVTEIRAAFKVG